MKKFILHLLLVLFIMACGNTDDSREGDDNATEPFVLEEKNIEGKIRLPEGSTVDLNTLSVQSFVGNSNIENESYAIGIPKNVPNVVFLTDGSEKVVMMGYNYPNQTNYDISAESTVIALALSMPFVSVITDNAKANYINDLRNNAEFPVVVASMEDIIKKNISPLDTEQYEFLDLFLPMFDSTFSNKVTTKQAASDPVNILPSGNRITFQNGGKFYETSIGIYYEGERVDYLELDRIQLFAQSASEAFSTANNLATADLSGINIEEKTYEFKQDGTYEIKIRTGADLDYTFESKEALFDNISKWSLDAFLAVIPLKGNKECIQHVLNEIRTYTEVYMQGREIKSVADCLSISYDISKAVIQNLSAGLECLSKNPEFKKFTSLAKAVFKWDTWVTRLGTAGNISFGIGQWLFVDRSSMDFCYEVKGNDVKPCGLGLLGKWAISGVRCGQSYTPSKEAIEFEPNSDKVIAYCPYGETCIATGTYSLNGENLVVELTYKWVSGCSSGGPQYNSEDKYEFNGVLDKSGTFSVPAFVGSLTYTYTRDRDDNNCPGNRKCTIQNAIISQWQ